MKRIACILVGLLAVASLRAQSAMQWQQVYGGNGVEVGYSVKTCMSHGYIVAGASSSNGPSDGHLIRTDTLGLVMWEKFYGGVNIDVIRSIKLLPDSGFICAGYTNSFGLGGYDGWVLRLDKNGDTLWTETYGTTDWDLFYDVAVTYDSGFVLAGGTYGAGAGDEDMWFMKIDSIGNIEWTRYWGGVKMDEARAVIETEDSLLVACGVTHSLGDTLGDAWILRFNHTDGDTLWTRKGLHSVGADQALGIASDNGQNRFGVVGQYTTSTGDLNAFVHIMFLDSVTQMDLTAGITGYEYYSGIVFTRTYNFATFGVTENDGLGSGELFFFHTVDYSAHSYGTSELEQGYSVDTTANKGYIVCGSSEGLSLGASQTYLVKIDSTGFSSAFVAVNERNATGTNCSVFPNPASDQINFSITSRTQLGEIHLVISDVSGRIMYVSASSDWSANNATSSSCTIPASCFAQGLYYYQIYSGEVFLSSGPISIVH